MNRDRSFGLTNEVAFDWRGPARAFAIPDDIARALYTRAVERTLDVRRAEELYLRWLRAEARGRKLDTTPVAPGGRTQVPSLMASAEAWKLRELEGVAPHKLTRVMLAFQESYTFLPTPGQKPAVPGRRTQVIQAPSRPGFDDYRGLGLRALLQRLGRAHPLRREVLAAAAQVERSIAWSAKDWLESLPRETASDPRGAALWHAAERHAVTLYRHAVSRGEADLADPAVEAALQQRGTGQPLPAELRREMERELGVSLSGVRIHTDAVAGQAAQALDAEAFTLGEDIFFAEGAFAPETRSGRKLLAHELTHVAQALRGDTTSPGGGLRVSKPGETSEREADAVAARVDQAATSPRARPAPPSPAAPSWLSAGDGSLAHEPARRLPQRSGTATVIQRQPKNATRSAAGGRPLSPGDVVTAMRISGSKVMVTFLRSGTSAYTLVHNSLAARAEPYHGTGKGAAPGADFAVTDAIGAIVISFRGTDKEPDPATFQYADTFLITVDDGSHAPAAGGGVAGPSRPAPDSTLPTIRVTDPKQIEVLKQKDLIFANQADPIASKLRKGETLTFEEALTLIDALHRVTSPGGKPDETKDSWLRWARFLEKNKDRITGHARTSRNGKSIEETQALLDEYKHFVGVPDPPTTTLKASIAEARTYDPQVARAWNNLRPQEKALWNAYLKDYGSTTRTSAEPRTDLHPTADDKMFMALNISAEYLPEGAAAQLKVLVNDPVFWASLMAGLTAYLLLWVAPEPIFTKAAAILTTVTILSVTGLAASQIIAVARAYMRLRDACEAATTLDEIRGAAREFGHAIGAAGANVLVTLALLLGGKALPARPTGSPPSLLPEPVPALVGGPGLAPAPVPAAAAEATAIPGYAIAISPSGQIVYMTAKADHAGGGEGRGEPAQGTPAQGKLAQATKPEIAPDELPPESPEAVTTAATDVTTQGKLVKGTIEHRAARWAEYQQRSGAWNYERWLTVYKANMTRAERAGATVKAYRDKLGWGDLEVTVDADGVPRRLDIADLEGSRAVEVKTGAQYATQENLWQILRDEILIKKYGWSIR
jgi:hypothetical protein